MDDVGGILGLIKQLTALAGEKGVPKDNVPKGIVPAPEGSSFSKESLSPILSTTERSRVKQIAEIFKATLFPGPEANKIDIAPDTSNINVTHKAETARVAVGVDKNSQESLGIIGSILGIGGGLGSGTGIAAAALPILAAAAGLAGAIYAAGPASKLFAEALVTLSTADWNGLERGGKMVKDFLYVGMDFIELMQELGMDTIERFFQIGRLNLDSVAKSIGVIATNVQLFKEVNWDDLAKTGATMTGLFGLLLASGTPLLAVMQGIGAFVISLGGMALGNVGMGLTTFSVGANNLFEVLNKYKELPLQTLATGLGAVIGILGTVAAAGIAAPLLAIGSLASQLAGIGMAELGKGLEIFGNSLGPLTIGIKTFETVDGDKLKAVSSGIVSVSTALLAFTASGFASSIISAFSSIFSSDGFGKFITLADKADNLTSATRAVIGLKEAFKEFSSLRTDNLAYNLNEIVDAVDNMNIDKLRKIYETPGGIMSETAAFEMKTLREYITLGDKRVGNAGGLIGIQKEILNVGNEQLKTMKDVRGLLVDIRSRIPVDTGKGKNIMMPSPSTTSPGVNNFRMDLNPLTIQPSYNR